MLAVFMAMGAWRISRARVLTRRAPAIETLGAATVLCTDKTGTLTENHMRVEFIAAGGARWRRAAHAPPPDALQIRIKGISIPRIPVKAGFSALPLVLAALTMSANSSSADCSKEFGNHITPTIATD